MQHCPFAALLHQISLAGAAPARPLTWHLPYSRTMAPAGQFCPLISWAGLP
jgi:hypothetical protein